MQEKFNEYMNNFRKLGLSEKKEILLKQLKMLALVTNEMCMNVNVDNELLTSKELLALENKNYTDETYIEALITLTNSIQNSISDFNFGISNIFEDINELKNGNINNL